jgi:predicted peptidase
MPRDFGIAVGRRSTEILRAMRLWHRSLPALAAILTFAAFARIVRTQEGQKPPPELAAAAQAFADECVQCAGKDYHFRLLKPLEPEKGKKYPLVLFLHGAGERGSDNLAQLKHFPEKMILAEYRKAFPCFLVAPQCQEGKQWVDAPWSDRNPTPMAAEPSEMLAQAIAALEKVRREHSAEIDPARIYLTGLSMGGFGTWELALRHPDWFAAAAPICGGGDESKAQRLKPLPLWAFHGQKDTVVWPERSQRMTAAVNAAGGTAKLTLLPDVGHNAWDAAYQLKDGVLAWMFAQAKTPAPK